MLASQQADTTHSQFNTMGSRSMLVSENNLVLALLKSHRAHLGLWFVLFCLKQSAYRGYNNFKDKKNGPILWSQQQTQKSMTNRGSDELFYKYFRLGTVIQKVEFV